MTKLEPGGFDYPDPVAICLDLIVAPEPKRAKLRAHVDRAARSAKDDTHARQARKPC
ncbi:hypothetical protein [Salinispora oceanensis]|uniref:hypothetical protein n=1 Tax=Salinispora oceanensis TaxID=1050199 RepID=UPI0003A7E3AB|nr:hypothetical protein [Salinispora oceanensis]